MQYLPARLLSAKKEGEKSMWSTSKLTLHVVAWQTRCSYCKEEKKSNRCQLGGKAIDAAMKDEG